MPGGGASSSSVSNLSSVEVSCAEELLRVFARGMAMRATASTQIHEHSSRSHCVLRVEVEGTPLPPQQPPAAAAAADSGGAHALALPPPPQLATRARLYLVDLAGG